MKSELEVREMKRRIIARKSSALKKGNDAKHKDMCVALRYIKMVLEEYKKWINMILMRLENF